MLKKILGDKKLLADIILVGVLLIVSLSVFLIFSLTKEEGSTVVVSVDGEKVAEYPLSVDSTYSLNAGTNILVVENGCAYISKATCPGYQDCVEAGKIRFVGEKIVCLPNKVIVEIVGEGEGIDI